MSCVYVKICYYGLGLSGNHYTAMKKTLILTAICSLAFAAAAEQQTPAAPAPAVVANTQSRVATDYLTFEVSGTANFAMNDLFKGMEAERNASVHTYGSDIAIGHTFEKYHSFNLRFGYAYGNADQDIINAWVGGSDTVTFNYDLNTFYLTTGYRFTYEVTPGVGLFLGVNSGIVNHSVKIKVRDTYVSDYASYQDAIGEHKSEWGWMYSFDAGCTVDLTENLYLIMAYQFSGSTAAPRFGGKDDNVGILTRAQYHHSVRIGVGFKF